MKYLKNTLDFVLEGRSVLTLGKFDGLHRGHQKLLAKVLEERKPGYSSVLFTFDVSPVARLSDPDFKLLFTNQERVHIAEKMGMDVFVECPFVAEIMHMEAEDFVKEILVDQLKATHMVVGTDFHFGYKRKGSPALLKELGPRYGFTVEVVDKVMDGEREISSTYVREEIVKAKMEKVRDLLGYPYFIKGEVVGGRQIGRTLGIPTINQRMEEFKLLPPYGVYATVTEIEGKSWYGMTNIGIKPTVGDDLPGAETNLFDMEEDLYGKKAIVYLHHYVRPEIRFPSLDAMMDQIALDEIACKKYFAEHPEINGKFEIFPVKQTSKK